MTDVHTHILPCVDDGSPSLEISLAMLKKEIENGADKIILTPHLRGDFKTPISGIVAAFDRFRSEAEAAGLSAKLYLGQELYYDADLLSKLKNGDALTLAGSRYVLLELPFHEGTDAPEVVYKFIREGFIPVIAHIERYPYISLDDAYDISEMGGLIQINADSLCEKSLGFMHKTAIRFFKEGLADLVASDIHSFRKNDFARAYSFVKKKFGARVAEKVFVANAEKILKDGRNNQNDK